MRVKVSRTSVVAMLTVGCQATPAVVEGYQSDPPAEKGVNVDNSSASEKSTKDKQSTLRFTRVLSVGWIF